MMRIRKKVALCAVGAGLGLALTLMMPCDPGGKDQGCVNQGSDCRKYALVTCWMQRHLSFRSDHEPHFIMIGRPDRAHIGIAWPPYLIFNSPGSNGHWRMFRIGFRYDRNWHGYIFPTIALKQIEQPLRY